MDTFCLKTYKRKSKEYRQYIDNIIEEYNSNGKKTLLVTADNGYPMVDGVLRVIYSCASIIKRDYPQYNIIFLCPDYMGEVFVGEFPILATRSVFIKSLQYQLSLPQFDGQLKRWLKKLRIDLIHCHAPFFCGFMARKLHLKRNIPMISTFHSQFKQDFMKASKSRVLTKLALKIIMRVFNDSDEVWTMHTASRETLYSYGYRGKCRLMPNATRMKPLDNYQEVRQKFREENGLQDKYVLIFVGRLITQKGVLFIADVLSVLKQKGVNFKMFFLGEGPDEKKLCAKLHSLNLNDEVQMVGQVTDYNKLGVYYSAADLFLFPSLYDVSSIVQIEAATYKTPTVFAEGSVTSCVVTDKVNGYLLPYDVQAYAEGVMNILNSGTMESVGENALRDLHVEWEDIVAESSRLYQELIEKNK